jgi:hypothetical protein
MTTAQQEALLLAGALLPPGTGAEAARNGSLDPVRAHRYTHQALDGRTVVRLVGESTAAEDGMLAFLGFGPATAGAPQPVPARRVAVRQATGPAVGGVEGAAVRSATPAAASCAVRSPACCRRWRCTSCSPPPGRASRLATVPGGVA